MNALALVFIAVYTQAAIAAAQAAFAQAEAQQMPCVVPGMLRNGETMILQNVGSGPALHVEATLTPPTGKAITRDIAGAIPAGEPDQLGPFPEDGTKIEVRYRSMSGVRYITSIEVIAPDAPGAKWRFKFRQIDTPASPLLTKLLKNISKK